VEFAFASDAAVSYAPPVIPKNSITSTTIYPDSRIGA
jgi:hypothetical protein